jgi:hypothetical protein
MVKEFALYKKDGTQAKDVKELNSELNKIGVHIDFFDLFEGIDYLTISIDEQRLHDAIKPVKPSKPMGRPRQYNFDFELVKQMRSQGMTFKQIYTKLGMSKALFYMHLKEYRKSHADF